MAPRAARVYRARAWRGGRLPPALSRGGWDRERAALGRMSGLWRTVRTLRRWIAGSGATRHSFAPAKEAAPVFRSQSSVLSRHVAGAALGSAVGRQPAQLEAGGDLRRGLLSPRPLVGFGWRRGLPGLALTPRRTSPAPREADPAAGHEETCRPRWRAGLPLRPRPARRREGQLSALAASGSGAISFDRSRLCTRLSTRFLRSGSFPQACTKASVARR